MTTSRIIVMEDDPFQSERIANNLKDAFPDMKIIECATEREFRQLIDDSDASSIACVVLDAMVPWDFPSEAMPVPPADVQTGDMFGAGSRCLRYARRKLGESIPACFHTILDREDAEIGNDDVVTIYVAKRPENEGLVKAVAGLLERADSIAKRSNQL